MPIGLYQITKNGTITLTGAAASTAISLAGMVFGTEAMEVPDEKK